MHLKKIKKTSKRKTCSLIHAFYAFLYVKFSRKKLSKQTKINKTTFLYAKETSCSKSVK